MWPIDCRPLNNNIFSYCILYFSPSLFHVKKVCNMQYFLMLHTFILNTSGLFQVSLGTELCPSWVRWTCFGYEHVRGELLNIFFKISILYHLLAYIQQDCSLVKQLRQCRISVSIPFYCASHILVQTNFRRYYFYFLPDQTQTHIEYFNVSDKLCAKISSKSDKG